MNDQGRSSRRSLLLIVAVATALLGVSAVGEALAASHPSSSKVGSGHTVSAASDSKTAGLQLDLRRVTVSNTDAISVIHLSFYRPVGASEFGHCGSAQFDWATGSYLVIRVRHGRLQGVVREGQTVLDVRVKRLSSTALMVSVPRSDIASSTIKTPWKAFAVGGGGCATAQRYDFVPDRGWIAPRG
jgi:hypothetical protein